MSQSNIPETEQEQASSCENINFPANSNKLSGKSHNNFFKPKTFVEKKISPFVDYHKLSLEDFWKSDKYYFGYDDIKEMCENVGLKFGSDDEVELKRDLFQSNLVISVYDFKDRIKAWRHYTTAKINDFLQKKANMMNDDSILKTKTSYSTQKKPQRPLSSISYNRKTDYGNYQNKSMQYLKMQKLKVKEQENKLIQAINKAKNQQQYEVLIKMGEANELNKEMQSLLTYRAYKNAQGHLKVKVFNLDIFQREIDLQQFQRQYNFIQKRFTQSKKIPVWDVLATTKNKIFSGEVQTSQIPKKSVKILDREQKKKKMVDILAETINLTNIFKEQLRILKAQGIEKKNA